MAEAGAPHEATAETAGLIPREATEATKEEVSRNPRKMKKETKSGVTKDMTMIEGQEMNTEDKGANSQKMKTRAITEEADVT